MWSGRFNSFFISAVSIEPRVTVDNPLPAHSRLMFCETIATSCAPVILAPSLFPPNSETSEARTNITGTSATFILLRLPPTTPRWSPSTTPLSVCVGASYT
jgi:hypothetical protein